MTDIVLITGAPGAGKSTIGRLLAERFDTVMERLRSRGGPFDELLLELGTDVFNRELAKPPGRRMEHRRLVPA